MKKFYTTIITVLVAAISFANTVTVENGLWTAQYKSSKIAATDVVIVKGTVTLNANIVVEGTLQVERGATILGNKDMMIAKGGQLLNNGSITTKRIINEGTINNTMMLETMQDLENRGTINNNQNVVAGSNLQNQGGSAQGNGGTYFVNNNVVTSPAAKYGTDVKIFVGNGVENAATANATSSLSLDANFSMQNGVTIKVYNPKKVNVNTYTIEKSNDGKTYQIVEMVNSNNGVMSYNDTQAENTVHYRVTANTANGQEIQLPVATVKVPNTATAAAF